MSNILSDTFEDCRRIGLVAHKTDFSRQFLGRAKHYLRLVEQRNSPASAKTLGILKARLRTISERTPRSIADEIVVLLQRIEAAEEVALFLAR